MSELPLTQLRQDERCQARAEFDPAWAASIAEYLSAKDRRGHYCQTPPVVVFRVASGADRGDWLADGAHRLEGHRTATPPRRVIQCDVRTHAGECPKCHAPASAGGPDPVRCECGQQFVLSRLCELRDAVLHAAAANRRHGKPRSNADKRRAALILLTDSEWCRWPDLRIAEHCGVSPTLVGTLREQMAEEGRPAPRGPRPKGGRPPRQERVSGNGKPPASTKELIDKLAGRRKAPGKKGAGADVARLRREMVVEMGVALHTAERDAITLGGGFLEARPHVQEAIDAHERAARAEKEG